MALNSALRLLAGRRIFGSVVSPRFFAHSIPTDAINVEELRHCVKPYNNWVAAIQHGSPSACRGIILSLHGIADSASSFDLLSPYFVSAGFCVVAVDLPGHGQSDWTGRYAYIDFAQDILSFVEAARLDSTSTGKPLMALSHSFGAEVTACLSCVVPDLFSKICLIECATFPPAGKHDKMDSAENSRDAYESYQLQLKKSQSKPRVYNKLEEAIAHRVKNQAFELSFEATAVLCRRCIRRNRNGFEFSHDPMLLATARNHGSTGWTATPCLDLEQRRYFHTRCKADLIWVKAKYASQLHGSDWDTYPRLQVFELGPLSHHVHLESPEIVADIALPFFAAGLSK